MPVAPSIPVRARAVSRSASRRLGRAEARNSLRRLVTLTPPLTPPHRGEGNKRSGFRFRTRRGEGDKRGDGRRFVASGGPWDRSVELPPLLPSPLRGGVGGGGRARAPTCIVPRMSGAPLKSRGQ